MVGVAGFGRGAAGPTCPGPGVVGPPQNFSHSALDLLVYPAIKCLFANICAFVNPTPRQVPFTHFHQVVVPGVVGPPVVTVPPLCEGPDGPAPGADGPAGPGVAGPTGPAVGPWDGPGADGPDGPGVEGVVGSRREGGPGNGGSPGPPPPLHGGVSSSSSELLPLPESTISPISKSGNV